MIAHITDDRTLKDDAMLVLTHMPISKPYKRGDWSHQRYDDSFHEQFLTTTVRTTVTTTV